MDKCDEYDFSHPAITKADMLTFAEVTELNVARCNRWHGPDGLDAWSIADWAVAMAGEAGEVCDAVKKLRRLEDDIQNISSILTEEQALDAIAEECADTFLYLNLLCVRIGRSLAEEVIKKFNSVSDKYSFPEKL